MKYTYAFIFVKNANKARRFYDLDSEDITKLLHKEEITIIE